MPVPEEATHQAIDDGWVLPPPQAREAICTRSIVCRSFRRSDGLIDIDGRFLDTRPFAYNSEFRGDCAPGDALHNMQLRLTIDAKRNIVALESAMAATPYQGCSGVNPNFQRLVGMSVGRGFRKSMRERVGGVEGCTHILALLDAMAAAAVQAQASNNHLLRKLGQAKPIKVWQIDALVGTCWSYHPDGDVVREMRAYASIEAKPSPEASDAPLPPTEPKP